MLRVLLEYLGDTIEVKPGETVVGRDLACQIRLNDPSVSRRHVRLLVGESSARCEDLGSTNGTQVNGRTLARASLALHDGDEIQIGARTLRVRLVQANAPQRGVPEEEQTLERPAAAAAVARAASELGLTPPTPEPARVPQPVEPPDLSALNCPQCGELVPPEARACLACGHEVPRSSPRAVTLVRPMALRPDRREGRRAVVEIAVIYASEALTFDAMARDLSRGGMFVATELLEPVGTECKITVLPDGAAAVTFAAVVAHVVEAQGPADDDSPPGLGVRFTEYGDDAAAWLARMLDRIESLPPE